MGDHVLDEYWLTFAIVPDLLAEERFTRLKGVVADFSLVWWMDAPGFIRFRSRHRRADIVAAICKVLDPADTILIGRPETAAALLARAHNDDRLQEVRPPHQRGRRRAPSEG